MSVLASAVVSGWLIGSAHRDDRWLLQALISQRQGQLELAGPAPKQPNRPQAHLNTSGHSRRQVKPRPAAIWPIKASTAGVGTAFGKPTMPVRSLVPQPLMNGVPGRASTVAGLNRIVKLSRRLFLS